MIFNRSHCCLKSNGRKGDNLWIRKKKKSPMDPGTHPQVLPHLPLLSLFTMPANNADDPATLAKTLAGTKLGTFELPITNLQHTTMGRRIHLDGVSTIRDSIRANGWLGSKMTACLVGSVPNGGLTEEVALEHQYRLVNGNHRLAALLQLFKEKSADDPSCEPTVIEVEVHAALTLGAQRHIASSE